MFEAAVALVAMLSAAIASVVGFGIGSLLTPLVATRLDMPVAVALVSIPHAAATALRCWRLRAAIHWTVLRRFGLLSAAGGVAGSLLYTQLGGPGLTLVLGGLLVLTATAGFTGLATRWHPRGLTVWLLGLLSGAFGGVAGNQGGLRAAALSAFGLAPAAFVATSTATGLLVDAARMPLYLQRSGAELAAHRPLVLVAVAGVLIGTLAGERVLRRLPADAFRRVVFGAVGVLGLWLLWIGAVRP
jgi:uncharacterized membrane protein YfcA